MWTITTAKAPFEYWLGKRPFYYSNRTNFIFICCRNGKNVDRGVSLVVTFYNATLSNKTYALYEMIDESRCSLEFVFRETGTRALSLKIFFDVDENSKFFSISVSIKKPKSWYLFARAPPCVEQIEGIG